MPEADIREFVEYVLQKLCSEPSQVQVVETEDDRGTLLTVTVAESDMGKIIGKEGQTISSLRTLVQSMGMRQQKKVYIKINDSGAASEEAS